MNQILLSASKQAKLPNHFSLLRRLCIQIDPPDTPTIPDRAQSPNPPAKAASDEEEEKEEAIVIQVVQLLQTTNNDYNSDELRNLLFSDPSLSPRCLLQVTRRLGSSSKALLFFEWLKSDPRSSRDSSLLSSAFQGLVELATRETDLQNRFLELLAMSKEYKIPLSINTATLLIRSFGRAGMVEESFNVFNELEPSSKNTNVRNVLIEGLLYLGHFEGALHVLDEMLESNAEFLPNDKTGDLFFEAVSKLDKLGKCVNEGEVIGLVSKLGEKGVFPNPICLTGLINMLCRSGKTGSAWDVLHAVMKFGGPVGAPSCNALLTGLRSERDYQRMNSLLAEMKEMNIQPSIATFGILINHLCKHRRVDEALEVFEKMRGGGNGSSIDPDVITFNTLIDGLCKVGRQEEGLVLMRRMRSEHGCSPSAVTFNCLIDGFCKAGEMDRARELFHKMNEEGILPNVVTVNVLIDGMCRHGRVSSAIEFFKEMQGKGLKGSAVTYTLLIKAFCNTNNIGKAKELFDEMSKAGCSADAIVYYTMISGLVQSGKLNDASFVASEMKRAGFCMDTTGYNVLLGGFCKKKKLEQAYELLKEMEESGVKPDSVTYNTLISYLCKIGDFEAAYSVVRKMIDDDLMPTVVTYGALIHGHCLNGNINEAMKIFRGMSSATRVPPSTVTYNILINWLCKNNDVETAVSLLDDMKKKKVSLNTATYNAIFKGLRDTNELKKAFELMDTMSEETCEPDYITMEILAGWFSAAGETEKLKSFVASYETIASNT